MWEDPTVDTETPPLDLVNALSAADYFEVGARLMCTHPPHLTDWSVLTRLARIGFVPGQPFNLHEQAAVVQAALTDVPALAVAHLGGQLPRLAPLVDGWLSLVDGIGVYGNSYVNRAVVAMVGLGANPTEDAVYPVLQLDADGVPLDGSYRYVLHFDAHRLPPVDAFWSVTMYDDQGFQAANELDRFAIGDRDPLTYNPDGSLDVYLQHERPAEELVPNWLPCPRGPLGVTMRLYGPRPEVLDGTWTPPPVRRVG